MGLLLARGIYLTDDVLDCRRTKQVELKLKSTAWLYPPSFSESFQAFQFHNTSRKEPGLQVSHRKSADESPGTYFHSIHKSGPTQSLRLVHVHTLDLDEGSIPEGKVGIDILERIVGQLPTRGTH